MPFGAFGLSGSIPFWKLQSIGNDFPLFHGHDLRELDLADLAKRASDRKFGIGGDGILIAERLGEGSVKMRMFNPDGTEDFCGNGLRIAAWHAFQNQWVGSKFVLLHGGQEISTEVHPDGSIATKLGPASYSPTDVPTTADHELFDVPIAEFEGRQWIGSALTTGSTHTILPVEALPTDEELAKFGPELEYLPLFPDRTSIIFCQEVEPKHLRIRIWERGVGETLGCGTGSSAAAVDYMRRTQGSGSVVVENPGGSITVSLDSWNSPIDVVGRATQTYSGTFHYKKSPQD